VAYYSEGPAVGFQAAVPASLQGVGAFSSDKNRSRPRVPRTERSEGPAFEFRDSDDVLDWFRKQVDEAGGGNYQSLINEALRVFCVPSAAEGRRHISQLQEPVEATLRRVIREELSDAG